MVTMICDQYGIPAIGPGFDRHGNQRMDFQSGRFVRIKNCLKTRAALNFPDQGQRHIPILGAKLVNRLRRRLRARRC
jgi:hypothetical protein